MATITAEAFDRRDKASFGFGNRDQARPYRLPVDFHNARAAIAIAATIFGSGQVRRITQSPQKRGLRIHFILDRAIIDGEFGHAAPL